MKFRGTIQYVRPPDVLKKELTPALREANAAAVEHWHKVYTPSHFTTQGARRYGYQKRSGEDEPPRIPARRHTKAGWVTRSIANPKYAWVKKRRKRHGRPLVWSGRSEEAARQIRITSTAARATGVLTVLPKYFYAFRKDLKTPDKADELTRVIEDEVREMATVHEEVMLTHLTTVSASKTVTVT